MWDVAPSRRTTVMISAAQWTKLLVARDGRVFGDRASAARAGVAGRNSRPRDINYAANYSAPAGRPAAMRGRWRRRHGAPPAPVRLRSPVPARSQTITGNMTYVPSPISTGRRRRISRVHRRRAPIRTAATLVARTAIYKFWQSLFTEKYGTSDE